jgi:hypothetical protein
LKKLITVFLFSVLLSSWGKAQINLVPNPGFEDTLRCTTGAGNQFQGYVKNWMGTNVQYITDACGYQYGYNQPANTWGWQWPLDGNAYTGIYTLFLDSFAANTNKRNYIYVPLTDSLRAGKNYFVSIHVSLANNCMYSCSDFGAYFSSTAPTLTGYTLPYTPQVQNDPVAQPLNDTTHWLEIKGRYAAAGGESYLTLGNFTPDSVAHTSYMHGQANHLYDWRFAFYYIDKVLVTLDTTGVMGIQDQKANSLPTVEFSPNPSDGHLQVNYDLKGETQATFELLDLSGKVVRSFALNPYKTRMELDVTTLNAGMYFSQVTSKGTRVPAGKLVLVK